MAQLENMALLLTASIDPAAMPGVTRADPAVRQADYLATLTHYLTGESWLRRVIFVENSGWDLTPLRHAAAQCGSTCAVEFISLNCNDFPRHLGKGYGELLMLDQALPQSQLAQASSHLVKLTGRLRLLNLRPILRRAPEDFDLLCDLRDHQLYRWLHLPATSQRCDSRCFAFRPAFYERFLRGRYDQCDDSRGVYLENVLYDVVQQAAGQARIVPRLATEPRFVGAPAHHGAAYDSPRAQARWLARWTARKLMPWVYW